jgi:hypothetical protein
LGAVIGQDPTDRHAVYDDESRSKRLIAVDVLGIYTYLVDKAPLAPRIDDRALPNGKGRVALSVKNRPLLTPFSW